MVLEMPVIIKGKRSASLFCDIGLEVNENEAASENVSVC